MTPNLAYLRIENNYRRPIRLWLPLFLLWIPFLLLLPLILLVAAGVCMAGRVNPWKAIAAFWAFSCGLPGTDVRVCADGNRVTVRIL